MLLNPAIDRNIDNTACAFFLSSSGSLGENELPQQRTFFHGIKKIAPHHVLEVTHDHVNHTSYLDLRQIFTYQIGSNTDYITIFKNCFDKAVRSRSKDQPMAIMLSGGIDSGTILASLASSELLENITAFNLSFRDQELYNSQDKEIAETLIRDFGINGVMSY